MANTTNYNWETPDDTDLVKDGAAAIRTLGSAVDTTTKALNPETTLGDIAYRSSTSNTNTRLGIGSSGQVLTVAAGVPSWATPTVGDITEVSAGTGISVASGTGPIPVITNTVATAIDAKGDLIVGTGGDTFSRLAVGTNTYTLVADSSEATGLKWAAPAGGGFTTAIFHDAKADTVAGGTFTSGAWRTRDLNTSQFNNITSCSLGSNQITLPAGSYQIWGFAPAFDVNRHQARFQNITDTSTTILGMSSYTRAGANAQTGYAAIQGAFTIAGTKTFEFQHRAETTASSNGFGVSADLGSGEIYAQITISKVA